MGLVVVHVDAGAVHGVAKTVPRPVQDLVAVSRVPQDRRRLSVHFPASEVAAGPHGPLHQIDGGIPGGGHRAKGPGEAFRHVATGVPHPGDIGVDRSRLFELAPQVEQHQLVRPD